MPRDLPTVTAMAIVLDVPGIIVLVILSLCVLFAVLVGSYVAIIYIRKPREYYQSWRPAKTPHYVQIRSEPP